jgi:hypothetical protein
MKDIDKEISCALLSGHCCAHVCMYVYVCVWTFRSAATNTQCVTVVIPNLVLKVSIDPLFCGWLSGLQQVTTIHRLEGQQWADGDTGQQFNGYVWTERDLADMRHADQCLHTVAQKVNSITP